MESDVNMDDDAEEQVPDQLFIATKVKNVFKRTEDDDGGCCSCVFKIVEFPLNFIRNYSCPMADFADWDRNRASILPLCVPAAFCFL